MFRERVIEHYRVRGYQVHENVKVRGGSGTIHFCDLVAEGPLGNLIVTFEDEDGFEGPELGAVRTAARDVGAAPVIAAPTISAPVVRAARDNGIVVLDEAAVGLVEEEGSAAQESAPEHPWPDPDRPRRSGAAAPGPTGAPPESPQGTGGGLWRHARAGSEAATTEVFADESEVTGGADATATRDRPFAWLKKTADDGGAGGADTIEQVADVEKRRDDILRVRIPQAAGPGWQRFIGPVVYGAVTAIMLWVLLWLFL